MSLRLPLNIAFLFFLLLRYASDVSVFRLSNLQSQTQSPSSPIRSAYMSDREKAELRGPVKTCVEETILPDGSKSLTTTEYSPDGRLLTFRTTNSDGSEWVTAQTYDADGHLAKTISGKMGEPNAETLYGYDEAGGLLTITNSPEKGGRIDFHYDEQGRKTTIQRFDPKTLERAQNTVSALSPWDTAESRIGIPAGGKITTIYDGNDQPTEAQIRDAEDRLVSRIVRTYDANGRLVKEEPIQENPALFFADRFGAEGRPQPTAAQLEAMNTAMKSLLRGRSGTGTSYIYDEQGRITKIHDRNFAFDKVTTISYNEHGDKSEERTTVAENSIVPVGVPYSVDENGTLIPSNPTTEPPISPALPGQSEVFYSYQYDSHGNWMEQTVNYGSGQGGAYEPSTGRRRTLTYY
jgi:YD repeat-containing protein